MSFHPQKCQVIHITTKHNTIKHPYNIHGHNLPETDTAKYLGVHIHKTLNWNTHINTTAHKANTTRAFLHRNIRTCNQKTKQIAYTALIRPILEYASIVWDPYTATNTHQLEMVQRRSARLVMHNFDPRSSVSNMLQQLQWPLVLHWAGSAVHIVHVVCIAATVGVMMVAALISVRLVTAGTSGGGSVGCRMLGDLFACRPSLQKKLAISAV